MSTIQQTLKDARTGMDKDIAHVKHEFASVRSGKASPNMLDTVRVEIYGQQMQLNQVATINTPDPRALIVTPFDKDSRSSKAIATPARAQTLGRAASSAFLARDERTAAQGAGEGRPQYAETGGSRSVTRALPRSAQKLNGVSEDDVKHAEGSSAARRLHHKVDELIKASRDHGSVSTV
jgi:ribosome recycling factor